ncbi:hypothetical protein [Candidatus Marimicrobium litorale]|uniref:Uncharacterized protein n=1 Tax=Candidatus Marimicrobium litorale TaxID=2518991 RepID=A0ABT3TAC9_9GAMM|nr:hypothetical protein [Candidatus Marimicrobium litorale]MCX2979226.1 hypothetical protein [Candidatus Marimicrobium litorale]
MYIVIGLLKILLGLVMIVAAFPVQLAWFGVCFGTVIIGLIVFFSFPVLMLAPFLVLWTKGWGLVADGLEEIGFRASHEDLATSFETHNNEQFSANPYVQKLLDNNSACKGVIMHPDLPEGYEFKEKGVFGTAFSPIIPYWYARRAGKVQWRYQVAEARQKSPKVLANLERKYKKLLAKELEWELWVRADEHHSSN